MLDLSKWNHYGNWPRAIVEDLRFHAINATTLLAAHYLPNSQFGNHVDIVVRYSPHTYHRDILALLARLQSVVEAQTIQSIHDAAEAGLSVDDIAAAAGQDPLDVAKAINQARSHQGEPPN